MSEDAVQAVLARAWALHRERLQSRLATVVEALAALEHGGAGDEGDAATDAHALAGALGTYGRPGSDLMKEAERALRSGTAAPGLAGRARALQAALRE